MAWIFFSVGFRWEFSRVLFPYQSHVGWQVDVRLKLGLWVVISKLGISSLYIYQGFPDYTCDVIRCGETPANMSGQARTASAISRRSSHLECSYGLFQITESFISRNDTVM